MAPGPLRDGRVPSECALRRLCRGPVRLGARPTPWFLAGRCPELSLGVALGPRLSPCPHKWQSPLRDPEMWSLLGPGLSRSLRWPVPGTRPRLSAVAPPPAREPRGQVCPSAWRPVFPAGASGPPSGHSAACAMADRASVPPGAAEGRRAQPRPSCVGAAPATPARPEQVRRCDFSASPNGSGAALAVPRAGSVRAQGRGAAAPRPPPC